jgi:hypothetical protein
MSVFRRFFHALKLLPLFLTSKMNINEYRMDFPVYGEKFQVLFGARRARSRRKFSSKLGFKSQKYVGSDNFLIRKKCSRVDLPILQHSISK